MPRCSFSGEEIPKGKGLIYVKKDGTVYYFASSKCKKNFLKLKREGRKQKWTPASREFKERQRGKAQKKATAKSKKSSRPLGAQPKIRVLNGCGVSGVASKIADKIRAGRLSISEEEITNAPSFNYEETIIKCREPNLKWAKYIAQQLDIDQDQIKLVPRNMSYPSVTVVVGKDYESII